MILFTLQQLTDIHTPFERIKAGLRESHPTYSTRKLIRHFEIQKGELFRRTIKHGLAYYRRCVPPSITKQILLACHDDKTAGHLGAHRTLDKITKCYSWPRMRRDIIRYVWSSADCQSKKKEPSNVQSDL